MRRFWIRLLSASAGLLVACPPLAEAAHGTVDLSWNACAPIVSSIVSPAAGPLSLYVSEIGNDQEHGGYQVRFQLATPGNTVPDAWRFDAAGCQGSFRLSMEHFAPPEVAATCPAFLGSASPVHIHEYSFFPPGVGFPTTTMRGLVAVAYSPVQTSLPQQRYFLARFLFDHTRSIAGPTTPGTTCGGFDSPLTIQLLIGMQDAGQCSYWLPGPQLELPFDGGNTTVTVNAAVPAGPATWGRIKSQYRR
jgi:hypothetical protein